MSGASFFETVSERVSERVRALASRRGTGARAAGAGGAGSIDVPVRDWVSTSAGQPTRLLGFDLTLIWVVLSLLALGLLMVYSASIAMNRL